MSKRWQFAKIRILTFSFIFVFFAINTLSGWHLLRLWGMRVADGRNFMDLDAVLINTDCYQEIGWDIYSVQPGDTCRNYVYGSTLIRLLDFLGLGHAQLIPLGWISIAVTTFILADLISRLFAFSNRIYFVGIGAAISPPIMLLVERGNFDWLVLGFVYLSAVFFSRGYKKTGFLLLIFSSLIKFYTFPVLIFALVLLKSNRERFFALLLSILALWQIVYDLQRMKGIIISGWQAAFGNTIWARYLLFREIQLNDFIAILLGCTITIGCVLVFTLIFSIPALKNYGLESLSTSGYLAIFSSISFLGCFFVGMNFDYRLIMLIPALWFIADNPALKRSLGYSVLFLIPFIFSFNFKILQPVGDFAINIIVALFIIYSFRVIQKSRFLEILGQRVK